jgi:hypothetical protein
MAKTGIASPTAIEGVVRESATACRRSKAQILFVLKIEKAACIFMQNSDEKREIYFFKAPPPSCY